jgi:hypothetical protein
MLFSSPNQDPTSQGFVVGHEKRTKQTAYRCSLDVVPKNRECNQCDPAERPTLSSLQTCEASTSLASNLAGLHRQVLLTIFSDSYMCKCTTKQGIESNSQLKLFQQRIHTFSPKDEGFLWYCYQMQNLVSSEGLQWLSCYMVIATSSPQLGN